MNIIKTTNLLAGITALFGVDYKGRLYRKAYSTSKQPDGIEL